MEILVENQQEAIPVSPALQGLIEQVVRQSLQAAGNHLGETVEVSVILVDDAAIHALNRDYRGMDKPTDVLSFSQLEDGEDEPAVAAGPDQPLLLGDIVVSLERAREQAGDYGHSFEREVGFLVCHGLLHLLGFDHQTPEAEAAMHAQAEAILGAMGLTR